MGIELPMGIRQHTLSFFWYINSMKGKKNMSIKHIIMGVIACILVLGFSIKSTYAGEEVGTLINIYPGIVYTEALGVMQYTCGFVDRIQIATGFEEKQSCSLVSKVNLSSNAMTFSIVSDKICPNPNNKLAKCWCSDYLVMTTGVCHYATNWSLEISPDGKADVVSYYGP